MNRKGIQKPVLCIPSVPWEPSVDYGRAGAGCSEIQDLGFWFEVCNRLALRKLLLLFELVSSSWGRKLRVLA